MMVIASTEESYWGSCRTISSNLRGVYDKLSDQFEIHWHWVLRSSSRLQSTSYQDEIEANFFNEVVRVKPHDIVFIDHKPRAGLILGNSMKKEAWPSDPQPTLNFHVYGDFVFFSHEWSALGKVLEGVPVRLFCASERHRDLVLSFMPGQADRLFVVPFPVDCNQWLSREEDRRAVRARYGVLEHQTVILYTGRISLQKNVFRLIEEFVLHRKSHPSALLWIIGAYDDPCGRMFGLSLPAGYLFQKMNKVLSRLDEVTRSSIRLLGPMDRGELRKVLAAADVFSSLSIYHTEDFGMAPAEALSAGLPCVLSDWGGYTSFAIDPKVCHLIPVELLAHGFALSSSKIQGALVVAGEADRSLAVRNQRGLRFGEVFSVDSIARRLADIFSRKAMAFSGFSKWKLQQVANYVESNRIHKEWLPGRGNFYDEVYRSYYVPRVIATEVDT